MLQLSGIFTHVTLAIDVIDACDLGNRMLWMPAKGDKGDIILTIHFIRGGMLWFINQSKQ